MADAQKYAEWLVANESKKGTPEFETVAEAYRAARSQPEPATAVERPPIPEMTARTPSLAESSGLVELAYKARNSELGRAAFGPGPNSGLVDSGFAPSVARYGIPIAAGLAAAPLTAGMSTLPAIATVSGVGAGSSALGSTIAQLIEKWSGERPELSGREIASETMLGATPIKTTGGAAGRMLANIPSAITSSEISRWLELGNDGYSIKPKDAKEAVSRYAAPAAITGALSFVGGRSSNVAEGGEKAAAIRNARFGGGITLTDVFPNSHQLEAGQLARGSELANNALQSIDVNIAEEVAKAFPSSQQIPELAGDLAKHVNSLSRLQDDAVKAAEAANLASSRAQEARMKLGAEMPALEAKAKEAALEVTKRELLYKAGVNTIFGLNAPDLTAVAQGRRIDEMAKLAAGVKDAAKSAIGELYAKAGVGVNEPVASLKQVLSRIDAQAGPGGRLEGDIAREEIKSAISKAFPKPEAAAPILDARGRPIAMPAEDTTITLEGYRNLRDKIASNLAQEGKDPKAANRIASAAYDAVRNASDDFISAARPDIVDSWRTAQAAAASEFKARETNAIGLLSEGKVDELYSKILSEGAGPVLAELKAYQGVLASTFDRANPASEAAALKSAKLFGEGVSKLIRDTAIDRSIDRSLGFDKDFRSVDFKKLTGELQALSSRGFDPYSLGLGSKEQVAAIARMSASAKNGGYTVAEFDKILKELPAIGADAAAARIDYQRAVRDEMLAAGADVKADAVKRLTVAAGKAKLSADAVQDIYQQAAKDPLVQLLNRTDMKLSRDIVDNVKWVDRLLTVGPAAAADFAEALTKSGRGAELEKIKTAAVATALRRFSPVADGPQKLNLQRITDFFFSGNKDAEVGRETLRSILGSAEYGRLVGQYAKPIKDILATQSILGQSDAAIRSMIDPNIVRAKAKVGGVGMVNIPVLREIISMSQAGHYKTLYTLYVDPKWAPRFAAAGRDIDKFAASSPVNAAVLKLAMDEDHANTQR